MDLSRRRFLALSGIAAVTPIGVSGCEKLVWPIGRSEASARSGGDPETVNIAHQPGFGYLPLELLKFQGTLEKKFPRTKFNWTVLKNGSLIRDGVERGAINVGGVGAGAFVFGWTKDIWKMSTHLSLADLPLLTNDPEIQRIGDFRKDGKRFTVPSPESTQASCAKAVANQLFGDARALEKAIQPMGHPDAVAAFLSGGISGHWSAIPFQDVEIKAGGRIIYRSSDILGSHSVFSVLAMSPDFFAKHRGLAGFLYEEVQKNRNLLRDNPGQVARIMTTTPEYKKMSESQIIASLTNKDIRFTGRPEGLLKLIETILIEPIQKPDGTTVSVPTTLDPLMLAA